MITRYSTPSITLTFTDEHLDLTQAHNVYVTFSEGDVELFTKTGDDLTIGEKTIGIYLHQEDTAKFRKSVEIQANWTGNDGYRQPSKAVVIPVTKNLLDRVVE